MPVVGGDFPQKAYGCNFVIFKKLYYFRTAERGILSNKNRKPKPARISTFNNSRRIIYFEYFSSALNNRKKFLLLCRINAGNFFICATPTAACISVILRCIRYVSKYIYGHSPQEVFLTSIETFFHTSYHSPVCTNNLVPSHGMT